MSAASNLAQTLGYHRVSSMSKDDETTRANKRRLFWTVFRVDKALSLRLGRPSTIQEWDVAMPEDPVEARWTKTAGIQGRVFDQLYSVCIQSRSEEERADNARALSEELRRLMSETPGQDNQV